jgi:hypothetical protein
MRKRSGQQMGPDPETGFPVPRKSASRQATAVARCPSRSEKTKVGISPSHKRLKKKPRMQGRLSWKTRKPGVTKKKKKEIPQFRPQPSESEPTNARDPLIP